MNKRTDKKFLNQTQAGPFLGVHYSTLSRWCAAGEGPPFYQVGSKKLFLLEDLEDWLEEQRNETDKK